MARTFDVALAEDAVVAEGGLRLATRGPECFVQFARRADDAHAAPTSAGGRLDHQRKADLIRLAGRDDGHTGLLRDALRLELVAARAERLGRWSDPDQLRCLDRFGEVGILGEE